MKLTVEQLFGHSGAFYPAVAKSITLEAVGTQYSFLEESEFLRLGLHEMNRVYWREMLYRAHWAAISSLIRHSRWFDACLIHASGTPNFPAFCATLRSLVEATADTSFSLGAVPETLASAASDIIAALEGTAPTLVVSQGLEEKLIHFQFAMRVEKGELSPPTHRAETASKYLSAIDHVDYPVKQLYSQLCQMIHPAAQSLHWFTETGEGYWAVSEPDDFAFILDFCTHHLNSLEWTLQQTVNISIFILQVLNAFPVESLHTQSTRSIRMDRINLHNKVSAAFSRNGISWPA